MNTNGAISFTNPISQYTPDSFPLANNSQKLIAPYWADVDTRGTGTIWYRETTDPDVLERADNEIGQAFPTLSGYASEFLFIATWDHVGHSQQATDRVCNNCTHNLIKIHSSEVPAKKTTNCTLQKTCIATTVSYLRVGPVSQFLPELCIHSHRICMTLGMP